jgi:hypothetical protein
MSFSMPMQAMWTRSQVRAHVGIALVGADDKPAGLGDGEVDAGEGGLGTEKVPAQVLARRLGERCASSSPAGVPRCS